MRGEIQYFTFISPTLCAPEKASPFTLNPSPSIQAGKSAAQCSSLCLLGQFCNVPKKEILYSTVLSLYCTLQKWCCEVGLSCAIYSALEVAVEIDALFSYSWQVDTEAGAMGAATESIEKTAQAHWELICGGFRVAQCTSLCS